MTTTVDEIVTGDGDADRGGGGSGSGGSGGGGGAGDGGPQGRGDRPRARSRVALYSAIVVACVVSLLIAVLATSNNPSTAEQQAASPLQGKAAPGISGPRLGGGSASLSSYRGKWVLLNFFASWCVPCQQEQGDLVRFQNDHARLGDAVIFGVRFDDPDTVPIEQLMSKSGAHWPIVDDPNAKIDYGVTGPPESFLIDPSGIVLVHIVGKISADALESLLSDVKVVDSSPAPGSTTSTPASGSGATPPASTPAAAGP